MGQQGAKLFTLEDRGHNFKNGFILIDFFFFE